MLPYEEFPTDYPPQTETGSGSGDGSGSIGTGGNPTTTANTDSPFITIGNGNTGGVLGFFRRPNSLNPNGGSGSILDAIKTFFFNAQTINTESTTVTKKKIEKKELEITPEVTQAAPISTPTLQRNLWPWVIGGVVVAVVVIGAVIWWQKRN